MNSNDELRIYENAEAQVNTQRYGKRPYGVGLLIAAYDVRAREIAARAAKL
jgi:20S proteasome alpha/beta subunit